MKDIKTKEVTTKPKTKNPASRIPKELMRTAILESKEKSQTIANARDNDMGEQSPSEYASGKVTSAEEWAARKTGRTEPEPERQPHRLPTRRSNREPLAKKKQKKKRRKKPPEEQGTHRPPILLAGKHPSRRAGKYRFRKPSGKRRFQMPSKRKSRRSGLPGRHQESRTDRR